MVDHVEARLVRVEGRVQGVGYREACVQQATAHGVSGWVRNRRDGSVEAMLQGPADAVARLQAWLGEGPPAARVERITATTVALPAARPGRFERLPTV